MNPEITRLHKVCQAKDREIGKTIEALKQVIDKAGKNDSYDFVERNRMEKEIINLCQKAIENLELTIG